MADKGIIFSAPMVRALLDGRKTQTRRLLKGVPDWVDQDRSPRFSCLTPRGFIEFRGYYPGDERMEATYGSKFVKLPYSRGDRLYVRERGWVAETGLAFLPFVGNETLKPLDVAGKPYKSRPSIHMPRWASRLWLNVTKVRVQRLHEISEADAIAEGIRRFSEDGPNHYQVRIDDGALSSPTARETFSLLWTSLHDKPGERWDDNPWIVAVTFDVHHGNIDRSAT